jgi:hypothetical protein
MRIAHYIWCALLFLVLLAPALLFTSIAVEKWRSAEYYRSAPGLAPEDRETQVEDALGHTQVAAALALSFGIGAALAVALPLRMAGLRIARYITHALFFLLPLVPAVFFTWRAVDLWQGAARHAAFLGLVALPFWIGAVLVVALSLRASPSEERRANS